MATQTLAVLTAENKTFYERTLVKRLLPNLVFHKFGQKKAIPKKEGDTVQFRKFESLPPATTPLTEGVTPAGKSLSISTLNATANQYGDFIEISDKIELVGIDPVLTESSELLGEQAGITMDTVVRDIVCAGTNIQYAGGKVGRDNLTAADMVKGKDIKKAVRTLKRNNVKRIDSFYVGIVDPDVEFDVMEDPLWQDISKYNGGTKIMDGEIGKIHGVRFITTTNTKVTTNTSGVDIHATMIIGKDAYGVCDVDGSSKPEMIIKSHGSSGTSDPLNQRATAGWKTLGTAVRLNELAMVRIESAATE